MFWSPCVGRERGVKKTFYSFVVDRKLERVVRTTFQDFVVHVLTKGFYLFCKYDMCWLQAWTLRMGRVQTRLWPCSNIWSLHWERQTSATSWLMTSSGYCWWRLVCTSHNGLLPGSSLAMIYTLYIHVVLAFLSWTLWGSPSMWTHILTCTSTGASP